MTPVITHAVATAVLLLFSTRSTVEGRTSGGSRGSEATSLRRQSVAARLRLSLIVSFDHSRIEILSEFLFCISPPVPTLILPDDEDGGREIVSSIPSHSEGIPKSLQD